MAYEWRSSVCIDREGLWLESGAKSIREDPLYTALRLRKAYLPALLIEPDDTSFIQKYLK